MAEWRADVSRRRTGPNPNTNKPFCYNYFRVWNSACSYLSVLLRALLLIIVAHAAAALPAATLERLSLEELARQSTAVVQGRVVGESVSQAGALLYTVKTIAVERRWKGEPASTVEVALPGGRLGNQVQRFGGAPALEAGRDYILFLWTGPSGRTQVTGFSQGVCELRTGADGAQRVVRLPSSDVVLTPGGSANEGDGSLDLPFDAFSSRIQEALSGAVAP